MDNLAAEVAAAKTIDHPDYALLASRIAVSNLHKETKKTFSEVIDDLHHYIDPKTNQNASLVADDVYAIIQENKEVFDSSIIYDRDFRYDYFGFKTLERSYLLRINGKIVERPQHMLMRVSVGIHLGDLKSVIETYDLMSKKFEVLRNHQNKQDWFIGLLASAKKYSEHCNTNSKVMTI